MTKDQLFLRVNEKYGFENKKKRDWFGEVYVLFISF